MAGVQFSVRHGTHFHLEQTLSFLDKPSFRCNISQTKLDRYTSIKKKHRLTTHEKLTLLNFESKERKNILVLVAKMKNVEYTMRYMPLFK